MASVFKRKKNGVPHGYWIAKFLDATGEWASKTTRMTDKKSAERRAQHWEDEAAKERDGLIDPAEKRRRAKAVAPLSELLDQYRTILVSRDSSPVHVNRTTQLCRDAIDAAGWKKPGDVHEDDLTGYMARLMTKVPGRHRDSRSNRTVQSVVIAIRGFTRWLVSQNVLPSDPLRGVKAPNPDAERSYRRRFVLPSEWPWLLKTTEAGGINHKMAGPERAALYAVAIETGLRSNELRGVTVGRCRLTDARPPIIHVSENAKNKRDARQFLSRATADRLAASIADRSSSDRAFRLPAKSNVAMMLRRDVERARQAWLASIEDEADREKWAASDFLSPTNGGGEILDFHCLRHTCGAWLVLRGVNVKVVQTVMRHSSITTTMDTYGHLMPDAVEAAVEGLSAWTAARPG